MRTLAVFLFFLLSSPAGFVMSAEMPVRQLRISGHPLSVEVAHTQATRSQGLMYRQSLGENNGMLFVFSEPGRHSMWMMNTDIPLSVAFLDEKGVILNIEDMAPRTATGHRSAGASKYAVEVNRGWFAARKVKPGERVTGLEKVPAAE
ncbi:DUF192 domain-containing protein [Nitrosovibrio sp. Nv6]|uniref:DUF192 domain-containing protein n=1 Tax=Nitrosovibrio sp. Nv6 TaxID=1855340 RepID=UPI0008C975A1|nr:DUF192 domain-containing protein [Nitrosovibrio sp. Nv6]SEO82660.1 hypothetical protein SAMN05216316_1203 [Nitrosovibrio sp. Nv6]